MSLAIENQADQRDEDGDMISMDDKISRLPEPILHHILSLLSQKDAVRTCLLSKSWRYLWCARPIIDFRESCTGHLSLPGRRCYCKTCFRGNKQAFLFALDNTLQRYHDQNLSVHQLCLEMSGNDPQSNYSLLKKWIPKLTLLDKGLKTFKLLLSPRRESEYFDLPMVLLFKAESLEILYLKGLKLSRINFTDEVLLLKRLQTLTLNEVHIEKQTLETILSSSPLLENVSLFGCEGFKNIKVCKPHGLKDIAINDRRSSSRPRRRFKDSACIVIDIPTIERIRVIDCWFHHHKYLPRLTSLFMNRAGLPGKSIDFLSGNYLPCLERLVLESCYLPQEFALRLSGSVKDLYFTNIMKYLKASIDAPNIVMFMYESQISQSAISFTTNSSEWKSNITVDAFTDLDNDASLWFDKLSELLKEFSRSEISLKLDQRKRDDKQLIIEDDPSCLFELVSKDTYWERRHEHEPVLEVEHFSLVGDYSYASLPVFLEYLFRIFRPRYIEQRLYFGDDETDTCRAGITKLTEAMMEMFVIMEKDMRQYFWPRGLEEVTMVEAFDERAQSFDGMKACFQFEWAGES